MSAVAGDAIQPHGGELIDLRASEAERAGLQAHAAQLPAVALNARDLADLEMLASGAFSPLTGFLGEADYVRSRDEMRLASEVPWPIPITLGVDDHTARSLTPGQDIALATESGARLAILKLAEVYRVDRRREAEAVFGTADEAHPGAKNVLAMAPWCLAGRVILFDSIPGRTFLDYPRDPRATRAKFRENGWRKIVAFQTRNPTHRAHEYIQKAALEILCDHFGNVQVRIRHQCGDAHESSTILVFGRRVHCNQRSARCAHPEIAPETRIRGCHLERERGGIQPGFDPALKLLPSIHSP